MKSFNFTEKMPNVNLLKRKEKIIVSRYRYPSRQSTMSSKTKDFIQKICYKKPPTIDMTQHGFANDNYKKPLKEQLGKLLGYKQQEKIIIPRSRYQSAVTKRGYIAPKSRANSAEYSYASSYSGDDRNSKASSVQAAPLVIYKKKRSWR